MKIIKRILKTLSPFIIIYLLTWDIKLVSVLFIGIIGGTMLLALILFTFIEFVRLSKYKDQDKDEFWDSIFETLKEN